MNSTNILIYAIQGLERGSSPNRNYFFINSIDKNKFNPKEDIDKLILFCKSLLEHDIKLTVFFIINIEEESFFTFCFYFESKKLVRQLYLIKLILNSQLRINYNYKLIPRPLSFDFYRIIKLMTYIISKFQSNEIVGAYFMGTPDSLKSNEVHTSRECLLKINNFQSLTPKIETKTKETIINKEEQLSVILNYNKKIGVKTDNGFYISFKNEETAKEFSKKINLIDNYIIKNCGVDKFNKFKNKNLFPSIINKNDNNKLQKDLITVLGFYHFIHIYINQKNKNAKWNENIYKLINEAPDNFNIFKEGIKENTRKLEQRIRRRILKLEELTKENILPKKDNQ